jgi:hypothetical protein
VQCRVAFLVMSAVSRPDTVDQLAGALAPHTVLVHHDFSQTPQFRLTAPNVHFVPDPKRTGWACFGFVDGIFHSLRYALEHLEFDYLQLLSPTCLPIKPMAQFEAHIAGGIQANFDCLDLLVDREALMGVGYRAFTPEGSLRHRMARRAADMYFAGCRGRRDEAGIWLRSGGGTGVLAWPAVVLMELLRRPFIGRHPFDGSLHPYYGTAWFGARREIASAMVAFFERPGIRDYFSRLRIAEEFLIPTMLMRLASTRGPMNHEIKKYQGARTGCFGDEDFELLRESPAFFARKFPDHPAAPIRSRVLAELVGAPQQDVCAASPWPPAASAVPARNQPLLPPALRAPEAGTAGTRFRGVRLADGARQAGDGAPSLWRRA